MKARSIRREMERRVDQVAPQRKSQLDMAVCIRNALVFTFDSDSDGEPQFPIDRREQTE